MVVVLLFCVCALRSDASTPDQPKRVLLVYRDEMRFPAEQSVDRGIRSRLGNTSDIQIYSEHLDESLFPDGSFQAKQRAWYRLKYRDRRIDLIIAVGLVPPEIVPNTPAVFCSIEPAALPDRPPNMTGIWLSPDFRGTLEEARRLQPDAHRVVVISGTTHWDRQFEAHLQKEAGQIGRDLEYNYWDDLSVDEVRRQLSKLPKNTIVLYLSIQHDATGRAFIPRDVLPQLSAASSAPMYGLSEDYVGFGIVGGSVTNFEEQGKQAAEIGLRILQGEKPTGIPPVQTASNYIFDWRAMQRWGFRESDLPPGSVVLNRKPTAWEQYKKYIVGSIFLILAQTLLIIGLLWQRAKKRKVEASLSRAIEQLRLSVEAGGSVGWDWDIKSGLSYRFGDLRTVFGSQSDTDSGPIENFYRHVHPDDHQQVYEAVTGARQNRKPYAAEYRVVWADGTVRWVAARGKFYYSKNGDAERLLGMAVDVTDRKLAEEALSNVSRRLIEAQDEERSRIARELHDDINQRVALVAINLERLKQGVPGALVDDRHGINVVCKDVADLGSDIHALSHRLHSSKLEHLGLVTAAESFCRELSERQRVDIDFLSVGVPKKLPQEISLCLFRILQEALQNAAKHSGQRQFQVRFCVESRDIHLTVIDSGVGFDVEAALRGHGLGLTSMKERLKLVGGEFSVASQFQHGTTIHARVPLMPAAKSASAAG